MSALPLQRANPRTIPDFIFEQTLALNARVSTHRAHYLDLCSVIFGINVDAEARGTMKDGDYTAETLAESRKRAIKFYFVFLA